VQKIKYLVFLKLFICSSVFAQAWQPIIPMPYCPTFHVEYKLEGTYQLRYKEFPSDSEYRYFNLPIYSLYSETRIPTDEMLDGIDHLFVDLQDVGTRIYTYIYTLTLLLEKCAGLDIEVIVLDRPNPINAKDIEGNILDTKFASFVGRHPIPVRHGLTIGEVALMHQKNWTDKKANLNVIEMNNYERSMDFEQTGLPYVNPSPNLPTIDGCFNFVGTVLFEGTNISEGRGTTRALEQIGHPKFDPWKYQAHFSELFSKLNLNGFILRPVSFYPMFQKHEHQSCGGYFIQITNRKLYKPWRISQVLLKEFKNILEYDFHYKTDPYEYERDMNPVDMINGTDKLRAWYEKPGEYEYLDFLENEKMQDYLNLRSNSLLYK
jgi:uncharacterized protein YbbC (DUF1343 family)